MEDPLNHLSGIQPESTTPVSSEEQAKLSKSDEKAKEIWSQLETLKEKGELTKTATREFLGKSLYKDFNNQTSVKIQKFINKISLNIFYKKEATQYKALDAQYTQFLRKMAQDALQEHREQQLKTAQMVLSPFEEKRKGVLAKLPEKDRSILEHVSPDSSLSIDSQHPKSSSEYLSYGQDAVNTHNNQCQESLKGENVEKNRYTNIAQYDENRVHLQAPREGETDYINAGTDPLWDNRLILSQGPKDNTVDDHWEMLWEQDVSRVFCLTKSMENGRAKTESYDVGKFGPITAQAKSLSLYFTGENGAVEKRTITDENEIYLYNLANAKEDFKPGKPAGFDTWFQQQNTDLESLKNLYSNRNLEEYALGFVVTLDVQKEGEDESRTIKLDHFSAWPDHGVPEGPAKALFADRLEKAYDLLRNGKPTLVHCSAGIGRTGVFWTGLRLMQEAEANLAEGKDPEANPNVPQTVLEGRMTVRPGLVQTNEQMEFIGPAYQAALPAVKHMVEGEDWKGSALKSLRQQRRQGT